MLNKRLRELREEKGLIQAELAEEIGIGRTSVSNYEKEERVPDADVIIKLADFFGVTTDYLLGRSEFKSFRQEYEFFIKRLGINDHPTFLNSFKQFLTDNDNDLPPHLSELNTLMVSIDENYTQVISKILLGNEKFRKPALDALGKLFNLIVYFGKLSEEPYDDDLRNYLAFLNAIKDIPQLAYADFENIQANQRQVKGCIRHLNEFLTMFTYSVFDLEKEKPITEE
jgi:transcriptional regulator with XRE-family HTH domain